MLQQRGLVPFKINEPSVSRRYNNETIINELEIDLDYKKAYSKVISKNQFIRGVVCLNTLKEDKIHFLKNDKIYSIGEDGELKERDRNENELIDNKVWGRFQYTKSLAGIDRYFFNHNISLYKKHRNKLHRLVSDLIYEELDRFKKEVKTSTI